MWLIVVYWIRKMSIWTQKQICWLQIKILIGQEALRLIILRNHILLFLHIDKTLRSIDILLRWISTWWSPRTLLHQTIRMRYIHLLLQLRVVVKCSSMVIWGLMRQISIILRNLLLVVKTVFFHLIDCWVSILGCISIIRCISVKRCVSIIWCIFIIWCVFIIWCISFILERLINSWACDGILTF